MAIKLTQRVQWGGVEYAPGQDIPGLSEGDQASLVYSNRAMWAATALTVGGVVPASIKPLTAAQLATYTGRTGEIVEVTDLPGRPQYRWDGSSLINTRQSADQSTPVLLIGGDHPYKQWLGDGSHDGTLPIYEQHKIKPYLAVNTDSEAAQQNPDSPNMLTWADLRTLSAQRMEVLSHGARHVQSWTKLNTGLLITYSGANATATVQCDGTNVILTDSGVTNIALAGNTLAQIAAAISAVSGWAATLAPELTGTESAANILTLAAAGAKSAKSSPARLAAGGGLVIRYTGTAYRSARVWKTGTALRLYGDNVPVASIGLTVAATDTMAEVATAITALGGGWSAWVADNNQSVEGLGGSYLSGDEASATLQDGYWNDCMSQDAILTAGLPQHYILRRLLIQARDKAIVNGVTFAGFAQSGGHFYDWTAAGVSDIHAVMRGNKYLWGAAPMPFAPADLGNIIPHHSISATAGYSSAARCTAMIEALASSPGHALNLLVHEVDPDGSSGKTLMPKQDSGALVESYWVALIEAIQSKVDAGAIRVVTLNDVRRATQPARNKLFNPPLRNSGESLVGVSSNSGLIIPGWLLNTPAQITAMSVADGVCTITSNSTATVYPLRQDVDLIPGQTYRLKMLITDISVSSGSGCALGLQRVYNHQGVAADPANSASPMFGTFATKSGVYEMLFVVPPATPRRAYVRSVNAQPFNLSTNNKIRLNINGKGLTADINCAGVTPSATTAKEIAAAINAALSADANYPAEYHTAARAEAGRVIIEAPYDYQMGMADTNAISVTSGTVTSAYAAIFGTSTGQDSIAVKRNAPLLPRSNSQYTFTLALAMTGSVTLSVLSVEQI